MHPLERRLRVLAAVNVATLVALAVVTLSGFAARRDARFSELSAERVNVLGPDGRPVLVLAGPGRLPGPQMNGKSYPAALADGRDRLSGMIFFNEQGDEVGGLIFNGIPRDSGRWSAVGHLSLDQWKQNQVVALQYLDNGRSRRAGVRVWDRPTDASVDRQLDRLAAMQGATPAVVDSLRRASSEAAARGEIGVERLFVGSQDRTAQLLLRDTRGRVRVRLAIDSLDVARLEFLDEQGRAVATYPAAPR